MKTGYKFTLNRRVYTQNDLESVYRKETVPVSTYTDKLKSRCTCTKKKAWKMLTSYFPILKFIFGYNFKESIIGDLLSGLSVSFMHLPQAMGFGILAGLKPVYGLYTTFFSVCIYAIFGTSPHISFGTNAVMALLTQNVVERELAYYKANSLNRTDDHLSQISFSEETFNGTIFNHLSGLKNMSSNNTSENLEEEFLKVKVGVAMTSSMIVGMILGGMGILRLGFLTTYLSTSFIGGFTTAASVHIASSQMPKAFGIKVGRHSGAGRLVKMYIDLFSNIDQTKVPEIVITIVCIVVLLFVKVCINERYKKYLKIPIPIDLLVVVGGTLLSHFANFNTTFNVSIVGFVPTGVPAPVLPPFGSASRIAMDCFVMAILSLTLSIAMAKLIAGQKGIKINDNQEILAYGLCHIGSSFFFCFPQATAPPRTMILATMGSKTTLNAVSTIIFMLLILLWIGRLFTSLPISVLAAMIIVSMKDLFLQIRDVPRYWKINKYDCLVWILTCAVSVLVDLDYGIICGVSVSIFLVVLQQQFAKGRLLGHSEFEDIIIKMKDTHRIIEYPGIKIFQFEAPIYFANAEIFKKQLNRLAANPLSIRKKLLLDKSNVPEYNEHDNQMYQSDEMLSKKQKSFSKELENSVPHHIIIDCQMVSHIDIAGVKMLKLIYKEYKEIKITVFLARCSSRVFKVLEAAGFFDEFSKENLFFDVIDAVEIASRETPEEKLLGANKYIEYVTKL